MRNSIKYAAVVALVLFPMLRAAAQQGEQLSVKRQPGEHLHYDVAFADGDIDKITSVTVHFKTSAIPPPNQQGAINQFGANCQKSADPKIWNCDVEIRSNVVGGDYQLFQVSVSTVNFGATYTEDFHVPLVPIENPNTFTPPSKVTVKQRP